MTQHVFLDTNVILDFFLDRKPFSDDAATILALTFNKKIKAFVSPLTLSDCYYVLRKLASHKNVIEKLGKLVSMVSITTMNQITIEVSFMVDFQGFEDALQYASASVHKPIEVILTRNPKDYRRSEISVMTPNAFLKTLAS